MENTAAVSTRILIVDDVPFIMGLIRGCILDHCPWFIVDTAQKGEEAVEKISHVPFDLILCDWELPDLKGDEILKQIREHERETGRRPIPFIMVTSHGEKEYIGKAIELGVSDYIVKPLNARVLMKKITSALCSPAFAGRSTEAMKSTD